MVKKVSHGRKREISNLISNNVLKGNKIKPDLPNAQTSVIWKIVARTHHVFELPTHLETTFNAIELGVDFPPD